MHGKSPLPHSAGPFCWRSDLEVFRRRRNSNEEVWIHRPVSGEVVRLDGRQYDRLRRLVSGGTRIDPADRAWIEEGRAWNLLRSTDGDAAIELAAPRESSRGKWWHQPLAIRLPGFPADWLARRLASRTGWLFSKHAVGCWFVFIGLTAMMLVLYSRSFASMCRGLIAFQAEHWIFVLGVLLTTKTIHELAHAAVCRRMGARCKQIGLLILCGAPCLYCDVSDSWRVESPRQRAAIMLAGVYVEAVAAALASWVWFFSNNITLAMAALNVVVLCGITTLFFNLNPLMRYDGYFVFSDLLNKTSLRRSAATAWFRFLSGVHGGGKRGANHIGSFGLAAFHLASVAYRIAVFVGLLLWFYAVLRHAGMEPMGRAIVIAAGLLYASKKATSSVRILTGQGPWKGVRKMRRFAIYGGGLGVIALLLWMPVRERVEAVGYVDYRDAAQVYIPHQGTITEVPRDYGIRTSPSQPLVILDEPSLRLQQQRAETEKSQLLLRRASLVRRALDEPQFLEQLATLDAAIEAATAKCQMLDRTLHSLSIYPVRAGMILPNLTPLRTIAPLPGSQSPPIRTPSLQQRETGTAARGEAWCRLGEPKSKHVVLKVDARQRSDFQVGTLVRLQLSVFPGTTIQTSVSAASSIENPLAGEPSALREPSGANRSEFQVTCPLPEPYATQVPVGTNAVGVVHGKERNLIEWLWVNAVGETL